MWAWTRGSSSWSRLQGQSIGFAAPERLQGFGGRPSTAGLAITQEVVDNGKRHFPWNPGVHHQLDGPLLREVVNVVEHGQLVVDPVNRRDPLEILFDDEARLRPDGMQEVFDEPRVGAFGERHEGYRGSVNVVKEAQQEANHAA